MLFDLQPEAGVPIYEQIVAQVIYGIASGVLPPGELLLSVREQASKLLVNPNTVARAYQELERRGIVVARRGRGMEIAADAPKLCRKQRGDILRERLRSVLREAALALPTDELQRLVEDELAKANGHPSARGKS